MIELIKRRDEKGAVLLLRHYTPLMRYIIEPILENEQDRDALFPKILLFAVHGADRVRARHDRAYRGGQAVPYEKAAQKSVGR